MGDMTLPGTIEAASEVPDTSLSLVMQAADSLVSSPEPGVVFESLVQVCAPVLCEAATATVSTPDGRIYATTWPVGGVAHWSQPDSVVTDFNAPGSPDHAGYHGLVSLRFSRPHESQPFVVQLLVERAMANVERARLVEAAVTRQATANHLELVRADVIELPPDVETFQRGNRKRRRLSSVRSRGRG